MTSEEFLNRLRPESFWDTERTRLDPRKHARFIIRRVMERGTREEVTAVNAFYPREEIAEALLGARSLEPKTLAYFSAVLDIPQDQFRAAHATPATYRNLAC